MFLFSCSSLWTTFVFLLFVAHLERSGGTEIGSVVWRGLGVSRKCVCVCVRACGSVFAHVRKRERVREQEREIKRVRWTERTGEMEMVRGREREEVREEKLPRV